MSPLIGDIAAGSPAVTCAERGMTPAGWGYLHGEWRILVVTTMADDQTEAPGRGRFAFVVAWFKMRAVRGGRGFLPYPASRIS